MRVSRCLLSLWLLENDAQARMASTTNFSNAAQRAYANKTAQPWLKPGAPPSDTWKISAKDKYTGTEVASINHSQARGVDRAFKEIALAVAMDWELFAADTYALLQAPYEAVHPWRTGRQVRPSWTEAEGNRFAAITSAIGDVLLMEVTKEALVVGDRWPNFTHALFFGQLQEAAIEEKLTSQDWQYYVCDAQINPNIVKTAYTPLHFIPQFAWVTMPLDVATFVGDLLTGKWQSEWAEYQQRGAALWKEYDTLYSPAVKDLLNALGAPSGTKAQVVSNLQILSDVAGSTDPVDILEKSQQLVSWATADLGAEQGILSANTYEATRSLYIEIGITNKESSPAIPTCSSPLIRFV